jgi:hypothetical protein
MIHNITAGHFHPTRHLDMRIVRRLLDELGGVDPDGAPTLGGWKVRFEDGCAILPWKGGRINHVAEEFAIRLQRETGCSLADREHGQTIEPGQLTGLAEKRAVAG